MKTIVRALGLLGRLSIMTAGLLLTQQALAVGTDAGVQVDNTALVDYQVNGNPQPQEPSNTSTFVVDRRVDFTVSRLGSALTSTTLGELPNVPDNYLDFYVTNLTNGPLDFDLLFAQLTAADGDIYPGQQDDDLVDMETVTIAVSAAEDTTPGTGDGPAPVFGGPTIIDDLGEDQSIRVRLYAKTPDAAANLNVAGLRLLASAADPTAGTLLTESASWNQGTIDNVFANASGADGAGNATESEIDGYIINAPELTVAKSATIVAPGTRALPGERIEYLIELVNAGTEAATSVSIGDIIDTDVTFVTDTYEGGASNVSFDGGATFCLADAGDANSDGCSWDGTTLTIAGSDRSTVPVVTPFTVPGSTTVEVRFQVEIPDTP